LPDEVLEVIGEEAAETLEVAIWLEVDVTPITVLGFGVAAHIAAELDIIMLVVLVVLVVLDDIAHNASMDGH